MAFKSSQTLQLFFAVSGSSLRHMSAVVMRSGAHHMYVTLLICWRSDEGIH